MKVISSKKEIPLLELKEVTTNHLFMCDIVTVPSAPEAPTLLASNYTSLTVSWMHPKSFNASSIIKYEVRLNGSIYTTHWTHITIGNLLAGTTYAFAVRALSSSHLLHKVLTLQ
jgi:hypothetical protein